jgi:hypothetical protein
VNTTTSWIDRNLSRLTIACAVGTIACLVLYAVLQKQVRNQARRGSDARMVQQLRYPIAVKMATDAQRRGVITPADLECYRNVARCPKPKTP